MKYRITFCVRDIRVDSIKELLQKKKGKLSSIQPEKSDLENYEELEAYFDNLQDLNSFIYSSYMKAGIYFFVNEIVRKSIVF